MSVVFHSSQEEDNVGLHAGTGGDSFSQPASQTLPSLPSLGCQVSRVTVSGVTLQVARIWEDSFLLVPLTSHILVWGVASLQVGVVHVFQGLGGPWAPASYLGPWATVGTTFSFTHTQCRG